MGVIDIASSKSVWRGMEYYKQNKVFRILLMKMEAAKV